MSSTSANRIPHRHNTLDVQRGHHPVRLFPVIFRINIRPRVGRAAVPKPLLRGLDPAGLAVDRLGNRVPENMGSCPLDEARRVNHGEVFLHDQMCCRAGQGVKTW